MAAKILNIAILSLFFAFCTNLYAEEIPPSLQAERRQKLPPQLELLPYGGSYLGNTVGQTWTAGGKVYLHIDNTWSFGVNYAYSRLLADRSSTFGASIEDANMHMADIECSISNDVAMRAGKKVVEVDFYLTLGAGVIKINDDWEPMGVIGGGAKFYTPIPWLAFRVDMNNYAHYTNMPGRDNFDFDIALVGGISFILPPRHKDAETLK